jgi:hypothetical protein
MVRKRTLRAALFFDQLFYRPDARLLYFSSDGIVIGTLFRYLPRIYCPSNA